MASRAREDSVRPQRLVGASGRPLNFAARRRRPPTIMFSAWCRKIILVLRFAKTLLGKKHVHDGVAIRGDDEFIRATVQALELLNSRAPDVYALLKTHIADVVSHKPSGVLTGALRQLPKTVVTMSRSYTERSTVEYAGALAHEIYHCELYRRAQRADPHGSVPANAHSGKDAERLCLSYQCDVLRRLGLDEAHVNRYESSLESKWWEVPLDQRDW